VYAIADRMAYPEAKRLMREIAASYQRFWCVPQAITTRPHSGANGHFSYTAATPAGLNRRELVADTLLDRGRLRSRVSRIEKERAR
jgi:hypothetical protein